MSSFQPKNAGWGILTDAQVSGSDLLNVAYRVGTLEIFITVTISKSNVSVGLILDIIFNLMMSFMNPT